MSELEKQENSSGVLDLAVNAQLLDQGVFVIGELFVPVVSRRASNAGTLITKQRAKLLAK